MKRPFRLELETGGRKEDERRRWGSAQAVVDYVSDYNRTASNDVKNWNMPKIEKFKVFNGRYLVWSLNFS